MKQCIMVVSHRAILRHVYTYMTKSDYQAIDFDNLGFFVAKYDDEKNGVLKKTAQREARNLYYNPKMRNLPKDEKEYEADIK